MRLFKISDVDGKKALYRCECGNTKVLFKSNVAPHKTRSCGCLRKEATSRRATTHGHSAGHKKAATYVCWKSMRQRCTNPKLRSWPHYGGRGISVCDRWDDYEAFFDDMGERPEGMSLDRIDVNQGYSPENCRWASWEQQMNNRTNSRLFEYAGEALTLAQWSRRIGVKAGTLLYRFRSGMSPEKALSCSGNMRWADRPFPTNDATTGLVRIA